MPNDLITDASGSYNFGGSLTPKKEPTPSLVKVDPNINYFGLTNFRNQNRRFGIKLDDRRRHMYVVGKTGMGKTTILENMVLNDIYAGHGVGLVDPHGDFAEKIIDFIPPHRINDVVYFNPADIDFPIGFNILETIKEEHKHLVASGLMGVFKKIWPDVWSARMEYILNNTILALLDYPGTTLLGINRLLADADYRRRVVNNLKDPVVKAFWMNEFAAYSEKYRQEAVAPIQNKIGQFLSASVIRNIVAQVTSRINIRDIMDNQKIFIMNLSKGRIGEDNSRLLGGMLITKIQLAAMERVDIPEPERKDFMFYVDEFQNFATESFANILSEARKYRLDLIMAHQYMEQLEEEVLAAVIGNVGTTVVFRVGSTDAEILAKEFVPTFIEEDLVNLPKYHVYLKLMIDGVSSRPFSALTLPPIGTKTDSAEKVVRVSRERYAVPRSKIEDKIARWSGMMVMDEEQASGLEIPDDEEMFGDVDTTKKSKPTPAVIQSGARDLPSPVTPDNVLSPSLPVIQSGAKDLLPQSQSTSPVKKRDPYAPVSPKPLPTPGGLNKSTGSKNSPQPPRSNFSSSSNKNKKNKNRSGNKNRSFTPGEPVIISNPNEKGISLSSLQPRPENPSPPRVTPPSQSSPQPPKPPQIPPAPPPAPIQPAPPPVAPKKDLILPPNTPAPSGPKPVSSGQVIKFD